MHLNKRKAYIKKYPLPWSQEKVQAFRQAVLDWYDQNKRDLPWRETRDPYKIWVSEIMLQQTQVETVIPYYQRFIRAIPDIQTLAAFDSQELLTYWQGLGYYSRVKNMQLAAQDLVENYGGQLPESFTELKKLKGIGPYTAAAIASMAFNQVEPAIDGNLVRIVTRLFELDCDVSRAESKHLIQAYYDQLIDPDRPGDFNQALMDIGATIMTKANTHIEASPIKAFDQSYQHGTAQLYPVKQAKKPASIHHYLAYYIRRPDGKVLVRQQDTRQLLAGLWHFPMLEQDIILEGASRGEVLEPLEALWDFDPAQLDLLSLVDPESDYSLWPQYPQVKHVFSHQVWYVDIIPLIYQGPELDLGPDMQWVDVPTFEGLPQSSLQRKLSQAIRQALR